MTSSSLVDVIRSVRMRGFPSYFVWDSARRLDAVLDGSSD